MDAGTPPRPRQEACWDAGHLPFLVPGSGPSPCTLTSSPGSPPLIGPARRARQLRVRPPVSGGHGSPSEGDCRPLLLDRVISETASPSGALDERALGGDYFFYFKPDVGSTQSGVSHGRCRLRMAAPAVYLCLGTWFLLNLIASFSGLKSRVASKQGQHQFNLITLHGGLPRRNAATGAPPGPRSG